MKLDMITDMVIKYRLPRNWVKYDRNAILTSLLEAKAAMLALTQIPYQRTWAEDLQRIQLKREVAGTSRIEGAEFTEKELDAALRESPEQLHTRSQKQAAAAVATYRWIAAIPAQQPLDETLIREVHRRVVKGCDDDHCPPGEIRGPDHNVTFGAPRHRGAAGGDECREAFRKLADAARTVFREHDPLVQALAMHYHFAAMHPFLDGNGRTARALEALMLQRVGLRDTLFIAMSNYYYEEKPAYLQALNDARAADHDLTPFLKFGLKGIESQCRRLFGEIRMHVAKALFRNTAAELFGRLKSPRKRVMSERQMRVLSLLLEADSLPLDELLEKTEHFYYSVKNRDKAALRDLAYLVELRAVTANRPATPPKDNAPVTIAINLDWPMQITETEFFAQMKKQPQARIGGFFSS